MKTSAQKYSAEARESILRFLWRQWSALGVAGSARTDDPWLIDPEALLLFSTSFARFDVRLFDEILDWLEKNGDAISLVRLSRMSKTESLGRPSVVAAIAEYLGNTSTSLNWQSIQKTAEPEKPEQALFVEVPLFGKPDPAFAKWGWQRELIETRGMSRSPRPDQAATFLFQLRGLFGRQARAEVLAWMLSHKSGHPARIARETSYYTRTVQQVLNDWEATGHARSFRDGREKVFTIRGEDWTSLVKWPPVGPDFFPRWINWAPLFRAVEQFLTAMDQWDETKSEQVAAIQFRELLEKMMPALQKAGLATQWRSHPRMKGAELIEALMYDLRQLMD